MKFAGSRSRARFGGDDGVGSISACAAILEDSDQRRGIAGIGL
jgi:hypothetical protein